MAKRKAKRRRRTTSEKVVIVLGILIALSMIASLFIGLGSGGTPSGSLPLEQSIPIGMAIEGVSSVVAGQFQGVAVLPGI